MNTMSLEDIIIGLENQMWEAFKSGNSKSFSELVSKDALMICGGFRETGAEYTNIVSQIRLEEYKLSDFAIKVIDLNNVLINYVVNVICSDPNMAGNYRVSSLWIYDGLKWQLVFNQDQRLGA